MSSLEKVSPGMTPRFLSQKMEQKLQRNHLFSMYKSTLLGMHDGFALAATVDKSPMYQ